MSNRDQLLRGGSVAVFLTVPTFAFALEPMQRWILETGFEPYPRYAEVAAGGHPQGECGYLPSRPQLVVDYRSGDYVLGIGTEGFGLDTTLQVTTPSGDVLCDDESGENGGDALITLETRKVVAMKSGSGPTHPMRSGQTPMCSSRNLMPEPLERASLSRTITSSRTGMSSMEPPAQ